MAFGHNCFICSGETDQGRCHGHGSLSFNEESGFVICHILEVPHWESLSTRSKFQQTAYCSQCMEKIREIKRVLEQLAALEKIVLSRKEEIETQLRDNCERRRKLRSQNEQVDVDPVDEFLDQIVTELNSTKLLSTLTRIKENRIGHKFSSLPSTATETSLVQEEFPHATIAESDDRNFQNSGQCLIKDQIKTEENMFMDGYDDHVHDHEDPQDEYLEDHQEQQNDISPNYAYASDICDVKFNPIADPLSDVMENDTFKITGYEATKNGIYVEDSEHDELPLAISSSPLAGTSADFMNPSTSTGKSRKLKPMKRKKLGHPGVKRAPVPVSPVLVKKGRCYLCKGRSTERTSSRTRCKGCHRFICKAHNRSFVSCLQCESLFVINGPNDPSTVDLAVVDPAAPLDIASAHATDP